jgi:AraC-like DNA-binding protein
MFNFDYIALRLARVKPEETWDRKGSGLAFLFCKSGVGEYTAGGNRCRFGLGEVLVMDLAKGGSLCSQNGRDFAFWHFCVSLEHMFPLLAANEICLVPTVIEQFKTGKIYAASSALARECHKLLDDMPSQFNLGHRSQLLRIVAAVLSEEFKNTEVKRVGTRPDQRMMHVFEQLPVDDLLRLSVPELAAKFNCSRRHLNRIFHQCFGVSAATVKMEMRLAKAASLLRDPDAKVIRVAEECGFNHLGLFNICFKKRFGASPGQWRNMTPESRNSTLKAEAGGGRDWQNRGRSVKITERDSSSAQLVANGTMAPRKPNGLDGAFAEAKSNSVLSSLGSMLQVCEQLHQP